MKKIKFLVLAITLMFGSQMMMAQDSTYISNEYTKAIALLRKAEKYNDVLIQKQALTEMLVLNPIDSAAMRMLAELYYNTRQYSSSALVGMDFLDKYNNDELALRIVAQSYENLRLYDNAVEYYEKLWLKTEDVIVQYQVAYLQYSLQRFAEAEINLGIIEGKLKDEDKIELGKTDGSSQEVSFKAAVHSLRGLMAVEQGKNEEAKGHFNKALALTPDFELAKNSLDALNKG
jgi:tetratricopeptide (TPR) repeat protein